MNILYYYYYCILILLLAGIPHADPDALQLAQQISSTDGVQLTGIYAHCGNTYNCTGEEQIKDVAQETTTMVLRFMEKYITIYL